ncbi:MAG: 4Fe-4S binding protein [Desulfarculus sp.]|nr:4Fe-4S binding protein [Desulfarculus sp.]
MRKLRNIIQIDEEKCTGCGQCILDCAEGALQLVDGKAKLVGEIFCDGLGACLSGCPTGALQVIQREADDFDEKAVEDLLRSQGRELPPTGQQPQHSHHEHGHHGHHGHEHGHGHHHGLAAAPQPALACGCPGSAAMSLAPGAAPATASGLAASQLGHWPIKLQLLNPQAPFLKNADLLLLADCAGASLPDLHGRLLRGRAIALACPKLDDAQAHIDKLAQVLATAQPRSLTTVIMEVPCCRGLEYIAQQALAKAGVQPQLGSLVVARDGRVLESHLPWE